MAKDLNAPFLLTLFVASMSIGGVKENQQRIIDENGFVQTRKLDLLR